MPRSAAAPSASVEDRPGETPQGGFRAGLFAETCCQPEEPGADFAAFAVALRGTFGPADAFEAYLVETIVACAWRLRRLRAYDAKLFCALEHELPIWDTCVAQDYGQRAASGILRSEANAERALYRAVEGLRSLRRERTQAKRSTAAAAKRRPDPAPSEQALLDFLRAV